MRNYNPLSLALFSLILFFGLATLQSCREDDTDSIAPTNQSQVTASIGGVVLNENGDGISGATVTLGNVGVETSPFGVFLFENAKMDSKRAFIKVNKAGYFLGSRVIKPNETSLSNVFKVKWP